MHFYKIYGLDVKSDYCLEEAYKMQKSAEFDVEIVAGEIAPAIAEETEIDKMMSGVSLHHFEKERGWIRAKGQGAFVIENGNKITYQLKSGYDPLQVNQLFLCAALPALLIQRGIISLHGSCVVMGDKGIVISGVSGAGKSTLTDKLLERQGIFMADDTVPLKIHHGKIYAQGAYPQQKICVENITENVKDRGELVLLPPDGGKEKYAVRLKKNFSMEEKELNAMFILYPGEVEEVVVEEILGSEKVKYLTDNLYKRKTYLEMGMPVEIFKGCIEIANAVKIYKITRPQNGMTVEEQYEKIKEILKN